MRGNEKTTGTTTDANVGEASWHKLTEPTERLQRSHSAWLARSLIPHYVSFYRSLRLLLRLFLSYSLKWEIPVVLALSHSWIIWSWTLFTLRLGISSAHFDSQNFSGSPLFSWLLSTGTLFAFPSKQAIPIPVGEGVYRIPTLNLIKINIISNTLFSHYEYYAA